MMSLIKKISLPLILALVIISVWSFTKPITSNKGLIEYVDPFIGSGGHGHVFVGATVPFGGVQVGPTNFNKGWDWSSSYHHTDSIVKGFCHLNVSGTGMSDLGELTIMPATGELKYNAGNQDNHMSGYSSLYRKNTEINTVGYYKVDLERYDINVELTASERVGFHRYTYPNSDNSRVIIDLGEGSADRPTETYLKKIDDTTFEGYRFSSGWARDQREYFTLVISKPVKDFILYDGGNKHDSDELKGEFVKGFLEFETKKNEEIYVKMGVSTVSSKNALENLNAEIPHWDFDKVKLEAENKWNQELSKINIKTEDLKRKRVFYTAMYHTMIAPNLYQDVNGEYRGTDKVVYKDTTFTNYTLFSLWDTYRAAHPLYTITHPERVSDMVNSMLKIFDHQGKLPIWHLRGNETNTMPGYSGIPVVIDASMKGFEGIDLEEVYEAVKESATGDHEPGVKKLMELGYIPGDYMVESVASSMEYAIGDWAIAQLAKKLNKDEDYNYFMKRSKAYKEYFDNETRFMRGKLTDGSWRNPFDPVRAEHRVNDYCEGNAWQYLWLVPQDPEGLIELLGGDEKYTEKLDELFSMSSELGEEASMDITGMIGQYAHGNEPSHHTTYMYAYSGQPYKIADKVRYINNELYTDKPDGLSGNEDCGQMSAWHIFSSLGFYPVNPSNGAYVFGSPLFDKASIALPENKKFTIIAKENSDHNIYIQSVELNGKDYKYSYITHKDIVQGGELIFNMGPKPNKNFGKEKEFRPQSIVY
ncbi:GH92 family glycosyl hydrolase [Flavobacteriaceae bacterium]|jgi:predicted alpha-1,2-mannosidase|nr:GH92 family glycosyl hydrolase [Flavobacteriaceae bacterium]